MVRQRSLYNLSFEDVQRPLLGNTGSESAYLVQEPSCDHHSFTKTSGIGVAWRGIVDHEHMNRSVETLLNEPTLGESTLDHFLANAGVINVADQNANVHTLPPMVIDSIHQQHWLQIPSVSPHQPHHYHHDQSQIIGNSQDFSVSNNSFYDSQLSYSENSAGIPMSPSYSDSSKTSRFRKRKHSNDEMLEKAVERRQKRMAKNRESAARSRAKKQEHIHRLENEKCRLQKVNCWLKKLKVKSRISLSLSRTLHSRPLPSALCPLALFPLPSRLLALSPSRLSPLASRPLPSALCPLPSCPLALFPLPSRPLALSPSRPLTLSPLALSPSPLSASRLQFLFSTKPQPQGTPQAAVQPLPQAAFIPCRKLPFNHAVGRCRSTVLERGISSSQGFHRHCKPYALKHS
ncbi:hypothetical protein VIGAN_03162200 [Vigna angularis var. angularis]|uniref:BZIP domain-containing protein n=1 Tax=Vigna angularis var. angularis TaxID=157739 RepID=A0A0S3RMF7_PHAAN|nr:hypothetical protein VIGAN_03162200 [Vigna angularis var. angularis]